MVGRCLEPCRLSHYIAGVDGSMPLSDDVQKLVLQALAVTPTMELIDGLREISPTPLTRLHEVILHPCPAFHLRLTFADL